MFDTYSCDSCHGVDGRTPALGVSRIIADIDSVRDAQNALFALQVPASQRDSAMKFVAEQLSPQEIVDVAAYIATL